MESFFLLLLIINLKVNFKIDRFFLKRLFRTFGKQLNHWRLINNTWNLACFQNFNEYTNDTILFQTRCFLHEGQEDVIEIHKQRYELIKLLRRHLKYFESHTSVVAGPWKYISPKI